MALTIALTLPVIGAVIYAVGAIATAAAFCMDEMSFVNPEYGRAILGGIVWPILLIQVTILARFDIYLGDIIREIK